MAFSAKAIPQEDFRPKGDIFFQTAFWASVKIFSGWQGFFFRVQNDGKSFDLMVLVKKILGPFSVAYIPGASLQGYAQADFFDDLSRAIKPILPKSVLMIRFDLLCPRGTLKAAGKFHKAASDVQPPDTVILSLDNEENILAQMKNKTRYNIRLCSKKGVVLREGKPEELELWYKLYKETSLRDKIALHPLDYYKTVFQTATQFPEVSMKLFLAEHESDLLAGIIVLKYRTQAVYLYGASSNVKRDFMPAYGLQWLAISDCLNTGNKEYDFFGIPPDDNPDHPMHGLYRFKTGFGGRIEHREGCWDWAVKGFFYTLYRKAESLRYWYFKVFKKF